MDGAGVLLLNKLALGAPALGALVDAAAKYGIGIYPLFVVWLWWRGRGAPDARRHTLLLSVLAAGLALAVNAALNSVFPRPRPFLALPVHVLFASPPHDASFPSDHAAVASAVTVMLWQIDARWGALGALGVLALGAARVAVGVHYPSDILGGMLVGAASAAAALRAEGVLRPALSFAVALARRCRLA